MKNTFQNSCAYAKKLAGATLVSASLLLWACAKPEKTPESLQHNTQTCVTEIQAPPDPIVKEDEMIVQTISFDEFTKARNDIMRKGEEFFLVLDEEQNKPSLLLTEFKNSTDGHKTLLKIWYMRKN